MEDLMIKGILKALLVAWVAKKFARRSEPREV